MRIMKIASTHGAMQPEEYQDALNKHGLNHRDAARLFGVAEDTSHNWAKGKTRVPKMARIILVGMSLVPGGRSTIEEWAI